MKKVFSYITFSISTLFYFIFLLLPVGYIAESSQQTQNTLEDTLGNLAVLLVYVVVFMFVSIVGFILSLVSAKLAHKPWIKSCSYVEFVLFCIGMAITIFLIFLMIVNP